MTHPAARRQSRLRRSSRPTRPEMGNRRHWLLLLLVLARRPFDRRSAPRPRGSAARTRCRLPAHRRPRRWRLTKSGRRPSTRARDLATAVALGASLVTTLPRPGRRMEPVPLLDEEPAVDLAKAEARARRQRCRDHPHVLPLGGKTGEGTLVERGRYENIRERSRQRSGPRAPRRRDRSGPRSHRRPRPGLRPTPVGRPWPRSSATATPQGFVCFTITAAARPSAEAEAMRADQLVHKLPSRLRVEQVQVGQAPGPRAGRHPPTSRLDSPALR